MLLIIIALCACVSNVSGGTVALWCCGTVGGARPLYVYGHHHSNVPLRKYTGKII